MKGCLGEKKKTDEDSILSRQMNALAMHLSGVLFHWRPDASKSFRLLASELVLCEIVRLVLPPSALVERYSLYWKHFLPCMCVVMN